MITETKPYVTLTDAIFDQQVLQSSQPVLVDFWAPWCGPCQAMNPIIEELAGDYKGRIAVGKVNVDEQPSLAAQFGIQSIPTLLIFKNGKVADTMIGAVSKNVLIDALDTALTSA